jgi:hypothetical protein
MEVGIRTLVALVDMLRLVEAADKERARVAADRGIFAASVERHIPWAEVDSRSLVTVELCIPGVEADNSTPVEAGGLQRGQEVKV